MGNKSDGQTNITKLKIKNIILFPNLFKNSLNIYGKTSCLKTNVKISKSQQALIDMTMNINVTLRN